MRLNHRLHAALWLLLPVCAGMTTMTDNARAAPRVGCEIRATHSDAGGKLEAVISANGPVAGTFVFTVRKHGGPVTSQSGDFKVDGAERAEIKKASVDLEPGAAYDASLEITWPNGSSSCSSRVG
jgi:hypothetical protein